MRAVGATLKSLAAEFVVQFQSKEIRGVEHPPLRLRTAYYLTAAVAVIALFSIAPGVYDFGRYWWQFQNDFPQPVGRWAYALLFVGLVQFCYAFYLGQLPDWSSMWVVSAFSLLIATAYAVLVVVFLLGGEQGRIITMMGLDPSLRLKAVLWSFSMLGLMSLLSYFGGRAAVGWQKTYALTIAAQEKSDYEDSRIGQTTTDGV